MSFISVATVSLLLLSLARLLFERWLRSNLSLTGLFLVTCSPVLWLHSTSGLESAVFGLLIGTIAWISVVGSGQQSHTSIVIAAVVLAVLLRSDGFVYVVPAALASMVRGNRSWKIILFSLVLGVLLLLTWRWVLFESLTPNTAIAKLNFDLHQRQYVGRELLLRVLLTSGVGVFVVLGITGLSLHGEWRTLAAGVTVVVLWVAYYVYIGGDHFLERHLIGLMFFCSAVSAPFWMRLGRVAAMVLASGMLVLVFAPLGLGDARFTYREEKLPDVWVEMGKRIGENRSNYGIVVCGPAGKIPFFAGGDFVDIIGLNDPELARISTASFWPGHSSGSMEVALSIARSYRREKVTYFLAYPDRVNVQFNSIDPEYVAIWYSNSDPRMGGLGRIPNTVIAEAEKRPYSLSMILFDNR
jgi:hypothetical protein